MAEFLMAGFCKRWILFVSLTLLQASIVWAQTEASGDTNNSKLFAFGETGEVQAKGNGQVKLGILWFLPSIQGSYSPWQNWEFDAMLAGFHVAEKEEFTVAVRQVGFKYAALSKTSISWLDTYDLALGTKLYAFRVYFSNEDSLKVDKNSEFLIPYVSQSLQKGNWSAHLQMALPLGGEKHDVTGSSSEEKRDATLITIWGLEYQSARMKWILEYWFTNMSGFLGTEGNSSLNGLSLDYNWQQYWLSYLFVGARLCPWQHFYMELGISTHYTLPAPPASGLILQLGWQFR